jgi:hypothetical protein
MNRKFKILFGVNVTCIIKSTFCTQKLFLEIGGIEEKINNNRKTITNRSNNTDL